MSERGKPGTFWALLIVILFVTFLVVVTAAFGGKSITYCYGQVTIVETGAGCPTPSPGK